MSKEKTTGLRSVARVLGWLLVPGYVASSVWQSALEGSAYFADGLGDQLLFVGFGGVVVVAAILLTRRPDHPITWLLTFVAAVITLGPPLETYAEASIRTTGSANALATFGLWLNAWYWLPAIGAILVFVPLLFPDGRWPSRRWRWVGWPLVAAWGGIVVVGMLSAQVATQGREYPDWEQLPGVFTCAYDEEEPSPLPSCEVIIDNPIGVPGADPEEGIGGLLLLPAMLLGLPAGAVAVVVRFRRSRAIERQQMKAFVWSTATLPLPMVFESVPVIGELALPLALVAVPTAIAVSILRYRLYDIDRLVSRTLAYAAVTAILAGVYVGLVLGAQGLLGSEGSDLRVAGATLVVAALFRPVRSRVQHVVDRRFNRARYDAEAVVARFGGDLRDQTDGPAIMADLQSAVAAAVHPRLVGVWMPLRDASREEVGP